MRDKYKKLRTLKKYRNKMYKMLSLIMREEIRTFLNSPKTRQVDWLDGCYQIMCYNEQN